MSTCCALSDAFVREERAAHAFVVRGVQRPSLHHQDRRAMALDAQRRAAWEIVYQRAQRWLRAGCFEVLADDLNMLLRLAAGQKCVTQCCRHRQSHPAFHARERRVPAMMGPSARRNPNCTWPSTCSVICLPRMWRPPPPTTATQVPNSLQTFRWFADLSSLLPIPHFR